MSYPEYPGYGIADISISDREAITKLENNLKATTDEDIILVAYKSSDSAK